MEDHSKGGEARRMAAETRTAGWQVSGDQTWIVVRASGELDLAVAPLLRTRLLSLARLGRTVEVDLSAVTFLDCAVLGVLYAAQDRLRVLGGDLFCSRPRGSVRQMLRLLGAEQDLLR